MLGILLQCVDTDDSGAIGAGAVSRIVGSRPVGVRRGGIWLRCAPDVPHPMT